MELEPFKNCGAFKKAIHINNNIDKPYSPCCWYSKPVDAGSWDKYQKRISKQDVEKTCKHCIDQESNGLASHRSNFVNEDELVIGVFFDNVCNLKCVTCGPSNSSQWAKDFSIINPTYNIKPWARLQTYTPDKIDFIKSILAEVTFKRLRIEIYGGEPLISVAMLEFLDWLYQQPYADCTRIQFSTNGTTYLPKLEKYMNKFRYDIIFSIDGVGQEFEYLRKNAVFDQVQSVIDRYQTKASARLKLSFNYTLSWMNSLYFADFFNWATTRYPDPRHRHITMTVLKDPRGLSINALPESKRNAICNLALSRMNSTPNKLIENMVRDSYKLSMMAVAPYTDNQDYLDGKLYLSKLDELRKTNYQETFKEVLSIIEG
jgi:sulfatase maturation enzyme AslB (radical SAM superfamily)